MNIILVGPQGSGKGTQAVLLAKRFGLCTISIGELLRKEAEKNTKRGLLIKNILKKGDLVPMEISVAVLKTYLEKNPCDAGIIFDGFPRTLEQAEALDEIADINYVIELKLSDEDAVQRLSSRKQCKNGHVYGKYIPPKKDGICDIDGEKLFLRDDDTPKAIMERLMIYHDETEPLLEYYAPRNIIHSINGSGSQEQVFEAICKIFSE